MATTLLVGTRKGLFVLREEDRWDLDGPLLPGWEVFHAVVDLRNGILLAAANHPRLGATVQRSADRGRHWSGAEPLPDVRAVWHVEPGTDPDGDRLWLGADPGLLLRSDDGGRTWRPNEAFSTLPGREEWRPSAAGLSCHSVQVTPDGLYVAVSAGGAFRSDDEGESWRPIVEGLDGPNVHKLLAHPSRPGRLWQQHMHGTYRSDDRGETWRRVDGNGLPTEFGFALALDPANPDLATVWPEESAELRVVADGQLRAYRTRDGGSSWAPHSSGLPTTAWTSVHREAAASDTAGTYFGTQSGSVFAERDGVWREVASHLPPIYSVETGPL